MTVRLFTQTFFLYFVLITRIFAQAPDPHLTPADSASGRSENSRKNVANYVAAKLVSEVKSIKPGQPFHIALQLKMDEGWHTYWQNPGDSGLATSIEWSLSEGLKASAIEWPYPEKISIPPFVAFGYSEKTLLLTRMSASDSLEPGTEKVIQANVSWLACKEVCIPGQAALELALPVLNEIPKADEKWVQEFAEARANLPVEAENWSFQAAKIRNKIVVAAEPPASVLFDLTSLEFFPLEQGAIDLSIPQKFKKARNGFEMELTLPAALDKPFTELRGVLVSKTDWYGNGAKHSLLIEIPIQK